MNLPRKNLDLVFVCLVLLDRIITLPFFAFEDNPIVIQMGARNWVFLTLILLPILVYVWRNFELYKLHLMISWLWINILLTSSVILANCFGILFYFVL